ncbi:MAG: VanZ family protein [Clostridia bacterium]|nr:VanZ family protein [Clostridia bacterium]
MKKRVSPADAGAVMLRPRWVRVLLWCCLLLTAAAIFVFSSQEGELSGELSEAVVRFIVGVVEEGQGSGTDPLQPGVYSFVCKLVRKTAHFLEFAALGFFLRMLAGAYGLRRATRLCWLAGTLYACTDELHQLFVAGRAGMWQDVLLDAGGVLAGITFAYALLVAVGRVRSRLAARHGKPRECAAED